MTGPAGPSGPGGLLAVHAHPDDETLSTGALLATWAAAGRPVTVVTCTRGEQGEVIPTALRHLEGDGPALAAHRERELAAALAALGVEDHLFLDRVAPPRAEDGGAPDGGAVVTGAAGRRFVDSGMAWAGAGRATHAEDVPVDAFVRVPLDDAAGRLAAVVRSRRPAVVVGYEPGGGYGHPDHVRAHEVLARAVELAAQGPDPWDVPVALWAVLEEAAWRAGVARLRDDGAALPDGLGVVADADRPSAVVGTPVDVRVDVEPVLDRVLAALGAHATQVHAVRRDPAGGPAVARFALSNDVLQPLLAHETYVVARGRSADVDWPRGVRA